MSNFSDYLDSLIENRGYTVYQISKQSGLDRTTIQRSIKGMRFPSFSFLQKLCDSLCITQTEKNHIIELYQMEKVGEKRYRARLYVRQLIEQISQMQFAGNAPSVSKEVRNETDHEEYRILKGNVAVSACLQSVLEKAYAEHKTIKTTLPQNYGAFYSYLKLLYFSNTDLWNIEHLVQLNNNQTETVDPLKNLEILASVLPFALCAKTGYQCSYYYGNSDIVADSGLVMPYYLCTYDELITVSADFETAIHIRVKDIAELYNNYFDSKWNQSKPLISSIVTSTALVGDSFSMLEESGMLSDSIEAYPCMLQYYTPQLVEKYLNPEIPNRKTFIELLFDYQKRAVSMMDNFTSYFSVEGLLLFSQKGIMTDLPVGLIEPISRSDRLYMLEHIKEDILSGKTVCHAINPNLFKVSPHVYLHQFENNEIRIVSSNTDNTISSVITEPMVTYCFQDFFEHLSETEYVYNKEKTIQLIDTCIQYAKCSTD